MIGQIMDAKYVQPAGADGGGFSPFGITSDADPMGCGPASKG
jgi:hypothetical protein